MTTAVDVVVVGLDGSEDSVAAFEWAASYVGPSGTVHAVYADESSGGANSAGSRAAAEDLLAGWCAQNRGRGTNVVPHVVQSEGAEALANVCHEVRAQMMVVGGHGLSSRRSRMIGTTTHRVLHDCELPVVVVRHGQQQTCVPGSSVLVGIGDGNATRAAVNWAVTFAQKRQLSLELLHALEHQTLHLLFTPVFSMEQAMEKAARYFDPQALRRWADDDLAELANRLRSQPGMDCVPISHTVVEGSPGAALVQAAKHASLLVMGKHFDGALTGYFTTATLHHALSHATCPVAVVPQEHGRD